MYCTESFTDTTTPGQITLTATCPNGGTIDDKKLCSDTIIQSTYGCPPGTKLDNNLCLTRYRSIRQGYYCPLNYFNENNDLSNAKCIRTYGKPTLTCPSEYDLTSLDGKSDIC